MRGGGWELDWECLGRAGGAEGTGSMGNDVPEHHQQQPGRLQRENNEIDEDETQTSRDFRWV